MKKQNLIKKIAVISSIVASLSGNMFAMNTTPFGNPGDISSNKRNVYIYKNLADRIVKSIAHVFYPRCGQTVQSIDGFWIERTAANEFMTVMAVIKRNGGGDVFDLQKLAVDLKDFQYTRGKITYKWLFVDRDKKLLRLIANTFNGDSRFFCKSLIRSWNKLAPYGHIVHSEPSENGCSNQ